MTARSKKTVQCFVSVAALVLSVSVARASGPVSVVGRGYGHGVGMSQYGAHRSRFGADASARAGRTR